MKVLTVVNQLLFSFHCANIHSGNWYQVRQENIGNDSLTIY